MMKTIAFAIALLGVGSLSADVLYWMAEEDPQETPFYCAQMVADDGQGTRVELNVFDMPNSQVLSGVTTVDANPSPGFATDAVWASLDSRDWSGYSFYVELLDEQDALVAKSATGLSYSDLEGHLKKTQLDQPTVLTVTGFNAVPEPTTGLLVLFGAAMLALRRKRT